MMHIPEMQRMGAQIDLHGATAAHRRRPIKGCAGDEYGLRASRW